MPLTCGKAEDALDELKQQANEYAKTHIIGDWQQNLLAELLFDFAKQQAQTAGRVPKEKL